jgi:hypothetical protein
VNESDGPADTCNVEREKADIPENEQNYCRATMNRKESETEGALEKRAIKNYGRINKKETATEKYTNEEDGIPSRLFVHEDGAFGRIKRQYVSSKDIV